MSGGSYNYKYQEIASLAYEIRAYAKGIPLRMQFAELLDKCADAAKTIEWVDSGDKGEGDEFAAIQKCFEASIQLTEYHKDALRPLLTLPSSMGTVGTITISNTTLYYQFQPVPCVENITMQLPIEIKPPC